MNLSITCDRSRRFISALLLSLMFFVTVAPITQQAGLTNDLGLTSTYADGLDDISIGADGKVSFSGSDAEDATVGGVLDRGKTIVGYIMAVCAITCIAFLILSVVKFAKSGDNEQERRKAMAGIITTIIGIGLLGASSFIFKFSFTLFNFTPVGG